MDYRLRQPHQEMEDVVSSLLMKLKVENVDILILMDLMVLCLVFMINTFLKKHTGKLRRSEV